jgi:hypothetical protein
MTTGDTITTARNIPQDFQRSGAAVPVTTPRDGFCCECRKPLTDSLFYCSEQCRDFHEWRAQEERTHQAHLRSIARAELRCAGRQVSRAETVEEWAAPAFAAWLLAAYAFTDTPLFVCVLLVLGGTWWAAHCVSRANAAAGRERERAERTCRHVQRRLPWGRHQR